MKLRYTICSSATNYSLKYETEIVKTLKIILNSLCCGFDHSQVKKFSSYLLWTISCRALHCVSTPYLWWSGIKAWHYSLHFPFSGSFREKWGHLWDSSSPDWTTQVSQNHRIIEYFWVGRDLWRLSSTTPCNKWGRSLLFSRLNRPSFLSLSS